MTAPSPDISLEQLQQVKYESPAPFQIRLDGQAVSCTRLLRVVPGKRLVFLGQYAGETTIIKLFIHSSRAKKHWSRELDGAVLLKEKQIMTPALIGSGISEERIFVLIFRYIEGQDLASFWKENSTAARERMLLNMLPVLAQHHASGLAHQDLHYGNFLISDSQEIYTLDPEEIQSRTAPLKRARRLENLALFLAQTFDVTKTVSLSLLDHYAHVSAINIKKHDPDKLWRWVKFYHLKRIDQYLNKILRECTEVVHKQIPHGYFLCRREHLDAELQKLLIKPDTFFQSDSSTYLKQGNTCTVKSVKVSGKRYVMKRYNPKGLMYELSHKGQMSRARRSWINAHLLRFIGISTPDPIALIENQPALGKRCSYFISQQIDGQSSWDFFCGHDSPDDKKRRVADRLIRTLEQLHEHRISHGDMKGSNFLIEKEKVWVIDLDALILHKRHRSFKAAWRRDRNRFARNWDNKACYEPWKLYFRRNQPDS